MRIPLTKYGMPQVAVFPAVIAVVMLVLWLAGRKVLPPAAVIAGEVLLFAVLVWVFSFFRDPQRAVPAGKGILLAPADGTVADISMTDDRGFIGVPAVRIGIFLSVFNVHINRSPCNAKVEQITYRAGKYLDARDPRAGRLNESNDLLLVRADEPKDKLLVRQISGAIARRIVCAAGEGEELAGGQRFGMIKFGSRTELYVPAGRTEVLVGAGDKVRAGVTVLARYPGCKD